jgi:hypothetical protein
VPITDVLAHYGILDGLEEARHGFEGACPFCGSNAFKVNVEKNVWFCFGECKNEAQGRGGTNGGNLLDFVSRKEGVSIRAAAEKIVAWFPIAERTSDVPKERVAHEQAAPSSNTAPAHEPEVKAVVSAGAQTEPVAAPAAAHAEDLTGRSNRPLDFTLKSVTFEHPVLEALGFSRETCETFGVAFFTGKGMMHDKVIIPFHDAEGILVAYAGFSPESGTYTYPKGFDPRLELYNAMRASDICLGERGLVLVSDLFDVLRLYELGIQRAVALPTETICPPQLSLLRDLVGDAGCIDFAPRALECVDTLAALLPHFYVRLHRNTKSDDTFITDVVHALGW